MGPAHAGLGHEPLDRIMDIGRCGHDLMMTHCADIGASHKTLQDSA